MQAEGQGFESPNLHGHDCKRVKKDVGIVTHGKHLSEVGIGLINLNATFMWAEPDAGFPGYFVAVVFAGSIPVSPTGLTDFS